jgi:hypothetical protein
MLTHCVFLDLPEDHDPAVLERSMGLLAGLVGQVEGLIDFEHGPNRDFEEKSPSFPYGFVCRFTDRSAHLAYEQHPDHQTGGGLLVEMCRGGYEGILVMDIESGA